MAFHVACPITCRKVCFCPFGRQSPPSQLSFLDDVLALENLLSQPAFLAAGGEDTVEVLVPRLAKDLKAKKKKIGAGQSGWDSGEETPISLSKKAVMRKKATMAAIAVAEAAALAEQAKKAAEAARLGAARQLAGAGAGAHSNGSDALGVAQATCELCLFSEVIGSKKADRMVSCPGCKKQYHRNCLKRWAGSRDLFNWSSWVCGSCRICEVCRRTGEPNKLMFCKRCDAAYHAYCQQPPIKHVPKPFLCPKHTFCHSCLARVPGSGVSLRWFLGYTSCDACGRLFMRGKYCPICLKVYRDSEASPMVCCDNCEHWVHCRCDGISDEKYREFQLDNNLHYKCAACRGDCYRVRNLDDAAEEIWRRRDEAERDVISQLQAAAGIFSKEENLKLSPSDDDEDRSDKRLLKKGLKPQPLKGKEQDGKKNEELAKSKNIKADKAGTGHLENHVKMVKFVSNADNRTGTKVLLHLPSKEKAKNNKIKMKIPPVTISSSKKSFAAEKGTDQFCSDAEELKYEGPFDRESLQIERDRFQDSHFGENGQQNVQDNRRGTKVILHLPSKEKAKQNKIKLKIPPVSGTDQFCSDAEEMKYEGPYDGEFALQIERDGFQDSHFQENGQHKQTSHQNVEDASAIHGWGSHGEGVRRRRIPSTKNRDMDASVRKAIKVSKENLNTSEKWRSSMTASLENPYSNEDLDSNDAASCKQGGSTMIAKKGRNERGRGVSVTSAMSQDEGFSGDPRKRLKVVDFGGRAEEKEGRLFESATKENNSKVSLKLKLKKPVDGNVKFLEHAERNSPKHGGGSAIRGQRSKRKKHHLLETGKLTDCEHEGEMIVNQNEDGKVSDDSWILQSLADMQMTKGLKLPTQGTDRGVKER